jgi:tetratricopeptide (TPR) repeat protein
MGPSRIGMPALLCGAVGLAYLIAFWGAFQFDDYHVILLNPAVHSWRGWRESMPGIRPLLKLSYVLNWVSGLGLLGFHAVNLLCHAASALCVFALCRRWGDALGLDPAQIPAVAVTTALLFALHPAQTEAVTYVSGRSVALMALCYLGACLAYRQDASGSRQLLSPLLFAAALFTKETAWTLPFAILLTEAAGCRASWRDRLWGLRLHWAVLALAAGAMLAMEGYRRLLMGSLAARDLGTNLLTQVGGQVYLLTQPLLLLRVNIDPDLAVLTTITPSLALKAAALLLLTLAGILQLRRRPWLGAGILWTFLHLLPTNSLLPRLDVANDRQLYVALIGPALILAVVLWGRLPRRAAALATLVLALGLGVATAERNLDYRTELSLWQATVRESPNKARVWNNLGYAYQLAGDIPAARRAYQHALALDPSHVKARINLDALSRMGEPR